MCCTQELLDKCHPLGMFDSIATLAVASSMRELYRLVLVDTPLAPYFSESLSAGRKLFYNLHAKGTMCAVPEKCLRLLELTLRHTQVSVLHETLCLRVSLGMSRHFSRHFVCRVSSSLKFCVL